MAQSRDTTLMQSTVKRFAEGGVITTDGIVFYHSSAIALMSLFSPFGLLLLLLQKTY